MGAGKGTKLRTWATEGVFMGTRMHAKSAPHMGHLWVKCTDEFRLTTGGHDRQGAQILT